LNLLKYLAETVTFSCPIYTAVLTSGGISTTNVL